MSEQVRPEVLISRLTSANESWRVDAEARLVSLGDSAVPSLIGALQHASPAVRIHAAHALARIQNPTAIPALISALEDTENNAAGAIAAEKALIAWGEPVKGALLQVALKGPERVRPRALRALGKIGGEDLDHPLRALLADPSAAVRTQAAAALAQIAGSRSVEALAPLLSDGDKWVRYGVAEALVRTGSIRGADVLEQARKDPEEEGSYLKFWADNLLEEIDELKRTGRAIP
jgi:HEAT repeat protein